MFLLLNYLALLCVLCLTYNSLRFKKMLCPFSIQRTCF